MARAPARVYLAVVIAVSLAAVLALAVGASMYMRAEERRLVLEAAAAALEDQQQRSAPDTRFFSGVLDHPTKCFSCERELPPDLAWLGQKTSCFSCETDLIQRNGGDPRAAFDAHAMRFY
jgi:hypothetical protein